MRKILVADDDAAIRELLRYHLSHAGFEIVQAAEGGETWALSQGGDFDLLLLDLMMPGLTALELVKKIRATGDVTPILILTARDDDLSRLMGLELGADDYLDKTTPMSEIVLRVKGLIRRRQDYDRAKAASHHRSALVIDDARKSVSCDGRDIALTKREFDILKLLVAADGAVVSRDRLLTAFWGLTSEVAETRTMDVLISRLRKKLGGRFIRSKRGFGYCFDENFEN